jgi:hypothetical protein
MKSLPPEYPGKFFVALTSTRHPMNHRPETLRVKIKRPTRKSELFCDSTGKFLSRATANPPSTEVSTLSSQLIKDAAALIGVAACWLFLLGQTAQDQSPRQY